MNTVTQRKKNPKNQWRGRVNNAQGFIFEDQIKKACEIYKTLGRAVIDKTPEPFRVLEKHEKGLFTGRFTAPAQPDFQGTLQGGKSIVFEAKYTTGDRINRNILTKEQMDALEDHYQLGAAAFVVFGIRDRFFAMPWRYWRDMKKHYNRQYLLPQELDNWRIVFSGAVMFLDYMMVIPQKKEQVSGNGSTGN